MTPCMCTVLTASIDDPPKSEPMKNLNIELGLSLMGSILVTHEAIGLIPRTSRKTENLEIEPGMVIHSCIISTWEAEAPDLSECKASLVYIVRPRST